jgi:hypothetical protein
MMGAHAARQIEESAMDLVFDAFRLTRDTAVRSEIKQVRARARACECV